MELTPQQALDAVQGSGEAFGQICQVLRYDLLRLAENLVRDKASAEDLVQESMLECYIKLGSLREPEKLPHWIRGVVRNRSYNHLRRKRVMSHTFAETDLLQSSAPDPLDSILAEETDRLLWSAVDNLTVRNRRAIHLYYQEEKSIREVSEILGISEAATRVRLTRSRSLLRETYLHPIDGKEIRKMTDKTEAKSILCSFCNGKAEDVELLITGPGVHICSSCVQACVNVMVTKGFSLQLDRRN